MHTLADTLMVERTLYFSIDRDKKGAKIGEGGGITETNPVFVASLSSLLRKVFDLDNRYTIKSFRRTSPKPGTHFSYEVTVEVDRNKEIDFLKNQLAIAENKLSPDEFKKYRTVGYEGLNQNIITAINLRSELTRLMEL